jgi:hypothetical protein
MAEGEDVTAEEIRAQTEANLTEALAAAQIAVDEERDEAALEHLSLAVDSAARVEDADRLQLIVELIETILGRAPSALGEQAEELHDRAGRAREKVRANSSPSGS